jgi:hypothetical protein
MFDTDYHTDLMWLHNISFRLDRFKKQNNVFVARCVYCGDSKKSNRVARLYFYTKKGNLNFDCKNCGEHGSFWKFMKDQFSDMFDEYKKDQMLLRLERGVKHTHKIIDTQPKIDASKETILGCTNILDLPDDHYVVQYLSDRGFDNEIIGRLLFSENFKETAQSISPIPLSPKFPVEPRIVIPFYTKDKKIDMIQGRSLDNNSSLKYITIKSSEDSEKIFGKDAIDNSKTSYCVEGPFDSLFVDNCVATCDSSLERSNADVLIWDNEPRNKEILFKIETAISNNRKVVIWPTSPDSKEDINDMILDGMTKKQIMEIIKKRTFKGLMAKLEFNKWKKM